MENQEKQELWYQVVQLEAENEALQEELAKAILRDSDGAVDGESELTKLRLEVARLRVKLKGLESKEEPGCDDAHKPFEQLKSSLIPSLLTLIEDQGMLVESNFTPTFFGELTGMHKANNILCTSMFLLEGKSFVLSASAKKDIVLVNALDSTVCATAVLPAPVVLLQSFNRGDKEVTVAFGTLDGTVGILQIADQNDSVQGIQMKVVTPEVHGANVHQKHITDLVWSPCGNWLASASRDQHVYLRKFESTNDGHISMNVVKDLHCTACPEALSFINAFGALCLAVAVRDNTCLHVLVVDDLPPGAQDCRSVKSSERDPDFTLHRVPLFGGKDSHVSFTILAMASAPILQPFLVCATDKNRHIIYETSTFSIVRDLYGHSNGGYGRPRIAWSNSGKWVFSNSEIEPELFVWNVATGQVVKRLEGHKKSVRDFCIRTSEETSYIESCSFDGTCRIWKFEDNDR